MMNIRISLLCVTFIFVGCGAAERTPTPPPTPVVADSVGSAPSAGAGLPAPVKGPPVTGDPASLYADCETRVEGSDSPGECSADSDCAVTGCSKELCISATEAAAGVMSTCEVRPCFSVLKDCGCNAGVCRWRVGS